MIKENSKRKKRRKHLLFEITVSIDTRTILKKENVETTLYGHSYGHSLTQLLRYQSCIFELMYGSLFLQKLLLF